MIRWHISIWIYQIVRWRESECQANKMDSSTPAVSRCFSDECGLSSLRLLNPHSSEKPFLRSAAGAEESRGEKI